MIPFLLTMEGRLFFVVFLLFCPKMFFSIDEVDWSKLEMIVLLIV